MVTGQLVTGPEVTEPGQLGVFFYNFGISERCRTYLLRGLPSIDGFDSLPHEFSAKTTLVVPDEYGVYQGCLQTAVNTVSRVGELSSVKVGLRDIEEDGLPAGLYVRVEPLGEDTPWKQLSPAIESAFQALIRSALALPEDATVPVRRFVQFRLRSTDTSVHWQIFFTTYSWCEVSSFEDHETYRWRRLI